MKISAGMEREGGSVVQNGGTTPTSGNNYNFTQNNYSTKATSRIGHLSSDEEPVLGVGKEIGGNMIHSICYHQSL